MDDFQFAKGNTALVRWLLEDAVRDLQVRSISNKPSIHEYTSNPSQNLGFDFAIAEDKGSRAAKWITPRYLFQGE